MTSSSPQPSSPSAGTEVVLATASYDHTIRFWEALSGLCLRTIQHPDSQVNRMAISPDKRYLAAAGNPHVRIYDVPSNHPNPITSYDGHSGNVTAVSYQSAGRWIVTSSEDGTIKIWDTRAPGVQRDYDLKTPVTDVIIHPNQGEIISSDQSGVVRIWDLGENACTHELVPEEDVPVKSVSMAGDGGILVAGNNKGNVYVWKVKSRGDVTDLEALQRIPAHSKYITKALLSPDTNLLATCSADHSIKLWRAGLQSYIGQDQDDGGGDEWGNGDAAEGDPYFVLEKTLTGHTRWVWDASFSADSAYMVTASSDNTARLWDLSSGDTIRNYNGHQKAVVCCALHDVSL